MDGQHFENRFLLYMDLLGIKEMTKNNPEKILSLVNRFSENVKSYTEDLQRTGEKKFNLKDFYPEISHFSDHIVVSCPITFKVIPSGNYSGFFIGALINIAIQLHRMAFEDGFLMRGAITFNALYHSGSKIVGEALIEAESLERMTASYPRVILSDTVISILDENKISPFVICKDMDGIHFINYFRETREFGLIGYDRPDEFENVFLEEIEKIYTIISQGVASSKDNIHIRSKWMWVKNKFIDEVKEHVYKFPRYKDKMKDFDFFDSID